MGAAATTAHKSTLSSSENDLASNPSMTRRLKARHDAAVPPWRPSIQSIHVPVAATSFRAQPRTRTHHKHVRKMLSTSWVQHGRFKTRSRATTASTNQCLICSSRQLVWIHSSGSAHNHRYDGWACGRHPSGFAQEKVDGPVAVVRLSQNGFGWGRGRPRRCLGHVLHSADPLGQWRLPSPYVWKS
jgi:hypothetical protein